MVALFAFICDLLSGDGGKRPSAKATTQPAQ